jgi:hypothetical protein
MPGVRLLAFLVLSAGLRVAYADPPVTEPQLSAASNFTSQEGIHRLMAQTYSITSESSVNTPTGSTPFRFALGRPMRLERFGKGLARYSLGLVQATWYRYGTNTGISFELRVLDFGGLKVDAGAAYARLSQYRSDGSGQDTSTKMFRCSPSRTGATFT